jgi:hypothetical protein
MLVDEQKSWRVQQGPVQVAGDRVYGEGDFVTRAVNRSVPSCNPAGICDGETHSRMELANRGLNSLIPLLPAILCVF